MTRMEFTASDMAGVTSLAQKLWRRYHVALMVAFGALPQIADAKDLHAERQATVAYVLSEDDLDSVNGIRATCVAGRQAAWIEQRRAIGLADLPDAPEYCVTALTRLGREGQLGYVRDPSGNAPTSALAFDTGFVAAFNKGEKITPDLPSMDALKSQAERCLAQNEVRTDVCSAAGYVFGVRAYNGEVMVVR